ncbi:DNA modification methylase [Desulfohalotomaculum tongense]|uniref:site-specific DNA-methyltransferase n=1 Tax=Desulforadius tongensis TaxID=1216062 RepID=UPI003084028C|nr:DNA modification methylase [Desulforadius tongensis]
MKDNAQALIGNKNPVNDRGENKAAKRANNLNGKEWLKNSISIWNDIAKTPEEKNAGHPASFPKSLAKRIIETFTTEDKKRILDPFLGIGTTLLAGQELNKEGIGFEISENYIKIARELLESNKPLGHQGLPQRIYPYDSRRLAAYIEPESIDLCFTSPPYWNVLAQKRSADRKEIRNYNTLEDNLGEIDSYERFLGELKVVFEQVFQVMKRGSYCIINVMDLRKKKKFYPLHMDVVKFMQEIGYIFDDLIIWDRRQDYNNLKPLGYPYVFRINRIHEYLLIFIKE